MATTATDYIVMRDTKFSELLINECLTLQFKRYDIGANSAARSEYADDIREHFGILNDRQ